MPKFKIPVRYVFEGHFEIDAPSHHEAAEYAEKHCGLVLGGNIHSSLPDHDVDWDFPTRPEKHVGTPEMIDGDEEASDSMRQGAHEESCPAIARAGHPAKCTCRGGNYVASGRGPRQLGAYDG